MSKSSKKNTEQANGKNLEVGPDDWYHQLN